MTSRETIGIRSTVHGHTKGHAKSREYEAYQGAKRRCNNPKRKDYARYGGRGIQFLFTNFEQFLAELGPHPGKGYSLDRIDTYRHYVPGNVRWATLSEQNNNRRPRMKGYARAPFTPEHIANIRIAQRRRWAKAKAA